MSNTTDCKIFGSFLTASQEQHSLVFADTKLQTLDRRVGSRNLLFHKELFEQSLDDWEGKPVVHDRMHWTLAEAINTSSVLYRVTEDKKYADDYAMFLEYLEEKVHDKVNGSWFHQLDQENKLLNTVWPGKSDIYHALQSMIIPYSMVSISIAKAVFNKTVLK